MAQSVRDVMTTNPTTLPATTTIGAAARAMRDKDIGAVIVVDDQDSACGIVTDRDIVVRAVADDLMPTDVRLGDVCSSELIAVDPSSSVKDAVKLMRQRALRRVPVIEKGRALGIVSLGDLAIEREPDSTLADISAAPPNT
jgi:signal-transduction protein with cAMP-binding, CBS, and nucleotidyltransferase domain